MTGRIRKLLSSCTRWVSREVRQEELNDFRVAVTEGSGGARIRLSGLLGNSALGICAVTVRTHGGRVNIILRQTWVRRCFLSVGWHARCTSRHSRLHLRKIWCRPSSDDAASSS